MNYYNYGKFFNMKDIYVSQFAKRIKDMRTDSKIMQDKLSVEIGYSQSAIAHWEAANREPSIDVLLNFASYFNVSVDYLLGLSNDKKLFNNNIESSFAERLKDLRAESSLTQAELAEKTGISQSSIAAWEIGKNSPKIKAFIVLAKFFGVTSDYMIGID